MATYALDEDFGDDPQADARAGTAVVQEREARGALHHPLRRRILEALAAPGSATTVAGALDVPRQLVNYHLRVLEKAGLVEEVGSRPKRGLTERLVRATAAHYVLSPETVGNATSVAKTRDTFSSTYQVAVAARTIREVAALAALARDAGKRLTTLTLDTEVTFATPADREAFGNELVTTINALVAKYSSGGTPGARAYRLFVGAHPVYRPSSNHEEPRS